MSNKDIYTGAIIPMIHALSYLYNQFKENPYSNVKWLDIKALTMAINSLNKDYVIINDKDLTIEKIGGAPPIITLS
ncbi:MAG: hypothetical protein IJ094_13030 [Bacilli bacterium]|nr:hypothetical protein [Bacilli bacterium]